jgi:hypothetical protein
MFTRWYKILQTCPFKTPFQVELLWEWHPWNCRWGRQLRIQVNELTEAPLNQPFLVIFSHPDGIPRGTIKVWTMEHLNLDAHGDNFSVAPFETLYYCCGHMWLFQNLAKCLLGTFGSVCICSTHTVYYKCTSKLFWSILGKDTFGYLAPVSTDYASESTMLSHAPSWELSPSISTWSFTEHRKALWRDLVERSATRTKHVGWNSETVWQRNLWITMAGRDAWIYVCSSCLWQVRALCSALIFSNGASFPSLERLGVLVLTLSWKHWKENLQETMVFPVKFRGFL